jgi:hypothetical protein
VGGGGAAAPRAGGGGGGMARGGDRGDRRPRAGRLLRRVEGLTPDQARAGLEAAREAAKVRADFRARRAALLLDARAALRAAAAPGTPPSPEARALSREEFRGRLAALRKEALPALEAAGRKAVAALTPEQRGRIEEAAKARGRTVDEARLARRTALRLSRPGAEALLRARVEGLPTTGR